MDSNKTRELLELRQKHVPQGPFNVTSIFAQQAEGAALRDVDGKDYIDFAGGIGVENVGHCAQKVIDAVKEQLEQFIHTCFHVVMYESYVQLAKKLNEITPGDHAKKTFFVNSGAEAVENAVKVARYATKRPAIVAFENAFHGRTYMAMSLTSKIKPYKWGFGPFCPEVYRMPFAYCYRCAFGLEYPSCNLHCADYLEDFFMSHVSAESTAAVIAEPVQGEGGFIVPPKDYFKKIKAICNKYGILLIMDEVQTGMGRTGKMFACEHFDVAPDIITTAKSLAAGLPLAGITGSAEIMDEPHVGGLGGTFGGNPLACRAGLAVLEILDEKTMQKSTELGKKVKARFDALYDKYEIIGDVRGLGPMMGIELVKDRKTKEPAGDETKALVKKLYERGLITISCGHYGNVVRTLMPLVITDDQLDKGFELLEKGLSEI